MSSSNAPLASPALSEQHESIEIRPRRAHVALAASAAAAFVALGLALLVFRHNPLERALGVLVIVFFGGLVGRALWTLVHRPAPLALRPAGLEVRTPGVRTRLVPWEDVGQIGVRTVHRQEFTTVMLRRYDALVAPLTHDETRVLMRRFGALRRLGLAAIFVGAANREGPGRVVRELAGTGAAASFADLLALQRQKHGADLIFGWAERDRDARAFAALLESYRMRRASNAQE